VTDSDAVRALRRQLGRRLAALRTDARYTQREFAHRISYARSTLSTVESGVQRAGRPFWQACDRVLHASGAFERGYDEIQAQQAAERQDARAPTPGQADIGLPAAATLNEALHAYQALGWPTVAHGRTAELVTGTVLDALEVPRPAGILAASWWQATAGAADPIRDLPALPDPRRSLAAIASADRLFFLTAAGSFPWTQQGRNDVPLAANAPLIGWHSGGSQIPAPPGTGTDGNPATWAYLPTESIQLPSPAMLLHLLAKAIAVMSQEPQQLTLPNGVHVIPCFASLAMNKRHS
jgi:transcriptional regulator with XRE-family HTH domain